MTDGKKSIICLARPESLPERLRELRAPKKPGLQKCAMYVLVEGAGHSALDSLRERVAKLLPDWAGPINVLAPDELSRVGDKVGTRERTNRLVHYIARTAIPRLIRNQKGGSSGTVLLLWEEADPVWLVAGSVLQLALSDVCWFRPPGGPWLQLGRELFTAHALRSPRYTNTDGGTGLLGESECMNSLRELIRVFAPLPFPVLLVGETGTGKELAARALHEQSGRSGSFASINAALLDRELAASRLFGHVKGAYTGAHETREGRIVEAVGGTFFLDELNSMPLGAQSHLLRALQEVEHAEIEIEPVGSKPSERKKLNVRLVSAIQAADDAELRSDLYHRVAGLRIDLPPLRERGDDVRLLAEAFIEDLASRKELGAGPVKLDGPAARRLQGYRWPGNVRELKQVIRQGWIIAQAGGSRTIGLRHIQLREPSSAALVPITKQLKHHVGLLVDLSVETALAQHPRSANAAAEALGFKTGQAMLRFRDSYLKHVETDGEDT